MAEFILKKPLVVKITVGLNPTEVLRSAGADLERMAAHGHRVENTVAARLKDHSGQLRVPLEASNTLLAKMNGKDTAYFYAEFGENGSLQLKSETNRSDYERYYLEPVQN